MTQFIFKRRDIQKWLDELHGCLSSAEVGALAKRLNSNDRFEAMWEVALLKSICMEKCFKHENPLPNGRCPDFSIQIDDKWGSFDLYGDITTLSDEGIDKQNPINFFIEELHRQKAKAGLLNLNLDWRVNDKKSGKDFLAKRVLLLPLKGEIPKVIKSHIIPILKEWKEGNIVGETRTIDEDGLSMRITRRPDARYSSGGYAGYQNVGKAEDSPLFKKLKSKKSQISGVPEGAANILVICDSDSHVIKPSLLYSPFTVDAHEICQTFLNKNSSMDLIALLAVETLPPQPFGHRLFDKRLRVQLIGQNKERRKEFLTDVRVNAVCDMVSRWVEQLPRPIIAPQNAKSRLKHEYGPTPRGGFNMSGNTVELSSRRVAELLAGIASPENWKHDFEGANPNPNAFFLKNIMEGRMIKSVEVKPMKGEDDDWLVVTFGEPDAAITPFKVKHYPKTKKE